MCRTTFHGVRNSVSKRDRVHGKYLLLDAVANGETVEFMSLCARMVRMPAEAKPDCALAGKFAVG